MSENQPPSYQATDNKQPLIFINKVKMRMWRHSLLLALGIFCFFFIYVFIYNNFSFSPKLIFPPVIAATAALMIGLSYAMSSLCYYFNFLDSKIAYRKYWGLTGYWLAVLYSLLLAFIFPDRYIFGFIKNFWTADILLGITAMTILTFMAVISQDWVMREMGAQRWRQALRFGYLASFLFVIRAYILEKDLWFTWLTGGGNLPPPRLLISIFTLVVIGLRASLEGSKLLHSQLFFKKE